MKDVMDWIQKLFIPLIVLLNFVIILIKKWVEKNKKSKKKKRWKEYSSKLGYTLEKTEAGNVYIKPRIMDKDAYVIEWPVLGGIKEGVALIVQLENPRIDITFKMEKKFSLFSSKSGRLSPGKVEENYNISVSDEAFKRKLLNTRVLTHIQSVKPESIFFVGKGQIQSELIPDEQEKGYYLVSTMQIPEDFRKVNQLVELGRTLIKVIDTL